MTTQISLTVVSNRVAINTRKSVDRVTWHTPNSSMWGAPTERGNGRADRNTCSSRTFNGFGMLGIHLAFVDLSFFLLNSSLISQASISSPLLTCSFAGIKQTSLPGVSITRNRDVNAACNMVNIGVLLALHGPARVAFLRHRHFPANGRERLPTSRPTACPRTACRSLPRWTRQRLPLL